MKKLNEWEFENEEFRPDRDRNEEPKKVSGKILTCIKNII